MEIDGKDRNLWVRDLDMPIISQDRGYIDELVLPDLFEKREKREFNPNTLEVYFRKNLRLKTHSL